MKEELLYDLKNKVNDNIDITNDEIINLKDKLGDGFEGNWWIIIVLLIVFFATPMIKGDEEQCTETTTDTITKQEV